MDDYSQSGFDCRLEWGWRGAERAARRGDHIVIVDVLSFSTTAATAAAQGVVIYPCQNEAEVGAVCDRTGAERGVHRRDVPEKGRFSLSPLSFLAAGKETRIAIASPNGATCCRLAAAELQTERNAVWLGALVNARATAQAVAVQKTTGTVTVLACGERWEDEQIGDGSLRFAVEDFWGAGAILSCLPSQWSRSPEARAAQAAFLDAAPDLENHLLACGSGQELMRKGYAGDVVHAARLNLYDTPVRFQSGQINATRLFSKSRRTAIRKTK